MRVSRGRSRPVTRASASLDAAARRHADAGFEGLDSGDYMGAHWLATFALLAISE